MTKSQIADVLQEIATLLELKDENPFKIRAFELTPTPRVLWKPLAEI